MKRICDYIKKKDTIFCFVIFIVTILLISQIFPVAISYDYLWNFQSTYKMYNGYELYKDINVIVTPFFFYIGLIFFKLFEPNFFTFNIYGAILNSLLITYIYITVKNLKCGKKIAVLVSLGLYTILQLALVANGANYNFLALILVLMGINLEIKENDRKSKWTEYLQGIITFLILFTKQNIGVYYLIAITVYKFWKNKNIKDRLIDCIKQYSVIFIFGILFLGYLKITNTWDGFFYYVLSGIKDFISNISMPEIGGNDVFFLVIPIILTILGTVGIKKRIFNQEEDKNIKLLILMSIASIGYIIPLANNFHISMVAVINVIAIIYIVKCVFNAEMKINQKVFKIIVIIMIGMAILEVAYIIFVGSREKMIYITDKKSPFFYTTMPEEIYNQIESITSYIKAKEEKGTNVIIIYEYSGLYTIPLKKSNGKFDCLNNGNLGKDAGQGVINEIKEMKNTEILILKDDDDVFWQEPEEVRAYIKENLEYTGEIEQFSIYKTK